MRRLILIAALLFPTSVSFAEDTDTVPIPKKRPAVLSVSPAYIEELRNREKSSSLVPMPEMYIDTVSQIEPSAGTVVPTEFEDQIKDLTSTEVLALLEHEEALLFEKVYDPETNIPIPGRKPGISEPITTEIEDEAEKRLVSFSLQPQQIKLDENLESFLQNHALDLFSRNQDLKLDIQAYATAEESHASADVRIALARALEVRKFLMQNNIAPSRIKLSPLGHDKKNNNDDRIDLVFIDLATETL